MQLPSEAQKSSDDWVVLTSNDNFSFMVKRKVAEMSGTLSNMLSTESAVVEKVCEYMAFKHYYSSVATNVEIPVNEFMERIPPELRTILKVHASQFAALAPHCCL
ncbi:hypothetical protein HWV62_16842 [Athelia sp. TMB]|nr:hypothetical protein HWV62_16842 [Athelia sp. TMB]